MSIVLIQDLLIILTAGLLAGFICRRFGISVLIGYLVVGVLIGGSALGLVSDHSEEVEFLAEAGVFFLLFSIGLEFSLEELLRLGKNLFVGGLTQMLLIATPTAFALSTTDLDVTAAIILGCAIAFSSTVLVFKALSEWGQSTTPHGRRAIGILLFQDAALVPLLVAIRLSVGDDDAGSPGAMALLLLASAALVASIVFARRVIARAVIPRLAQYRSNDLILLLTLVTLGGTTWATHVVGLPPAIGAFAAGLLFSGNRWTQQVDALIFPFRESFAAIFFVSLGLLARPQMLWEEPLTLVASVAAVVLIKTAAAAIALRLTGLGWRQALGMGLGLAHIGEFAFVLTLLAEESGLIEQAHYYRVITVGIASLMLTPLLIRLGVGMCEVSTESAADPERVIPKLRGCSRALVIGAGPAGRQVASRLETVGNEVCVVDFSPVNLHTFSLLGFRTIAGDASEPNILAHAEAADAAIVVICVGDDADAVKIAKQVRKGNPSATLVIRCRYHANVTDLVRLGADHVVSEEALASDALLRLIDDHVEVK